MIDVIDLGPIDYEKAYEFQKQRLELCQNKAVPDTLILCQHPPVFTIGRSGSEDNIRVPEKTYKKKGIKVSHIDRGGDITYHGPGQLIAYPIFDLKNHGQDIHAFLRNLEQVVIDFLAEFKIKAGRKKDYTGVWVNDSKIASIGIGASRWVSFHGLALNIDNEDEYFSMINPCGIEGVNMTSLIEEFNKNDLSEPDDGKIEMEHIKKTLVKCFEQVFDVSYCQAKIG